MEPKPIEPPITTGNEKEQETTKTKNKDDPRRNEKTTIQILKGTAEDLTDCKHGRDTYDDVIIRHMTHWKKYNP